MVFSKIKKLQKELNKVVKNIEGEFQYWSGHKGGMKGRDISRMAEFAYAMELLNTANQIFDEFANDKVVSSKELKFYKFDLKIKDGRLEIKPQRKGKEMYILSPSNVVLGKLDSVNISLPK